MSDSERKIFPVETVLALVSGKEDADVREIAGYITGRSMVCPKMAKSVAAFAGAWLARLYPKFADMVYDGSEAWELFVNRCAAQLGDKISLPPMDGRIKESCLAALDAMDKAFAEVDALKAEVTKQAAEIEVLKPLEGALEAAKKQADQLDAQLKAQKKDMGALRRQAAGFEGKIALDEEELLDTIKRTIKDNLKNITVAAGGAAAAGAVAGEAAAEGGEAAAEEAPAEDESMGFGFGDDDSTGFGF